MTTVTAGGSALALDVQGPLSDGLRTVVTFVPKFIAFIAILVIGYFVAKALAKVVDKVLERVGFDRAVERGGVGQALARSKYDASDLVAKFIYYALLLFTLQLAFGIWGPNPVSDLLKGVVSWLPKAAVAIIIVVVAAAIANAVKDLITGSLGGLSYGRLVANIAAAFIIGLGVIAALTQIGIAVAVTVPVLIAVLATIGGILIVGVGGGLVRPMQERWTRWLDQAEQQAPILKGQAEAYQRGREDAGRLTTTDTQVVATEPSSTVYAAPPAGTVSEGAPPAWRCPRCSQAAAFLLGREWALADTVRASWHAARMRRLIRSSG
jgi:hypothetical protein